MVYLIRHGNVESTGSSDPPLSEEGRESAAAGARLISADGGSIDMLLCSPLRRAVEHANIVGELTDKAVRVSESLEPDGDCGDIVQELLNDRWKFVAIIGHLPQLKRLVSMLISDAAPVGIHFETGGIASIEANVIDGELKGALRWLAGRTMLDVFRS